MGVEDHLILVPHDIREYIEVHIENIANLISLTTEASRSISSPNPCIGLITENDVDKGFLSDKKGFKIEFNREIPIFDLTPINFIEFAKDLADRIDGVALYTEALLNQMTSGKFREFNRLFERAFKLASYKLVDPLTKFLQPLNLNYSKDEIKEWIDLRHSISHADKKDTFALDRDVLKYMSRLEIAVKDVFLNKKNWRKQDTERREIWKPTAGQATQKSDIFLKHGSDIKLEFHLMDYFGSYPRNLKANLNAPPKEWWCKEVIVD